MVIFISISLFVGVDRSVTSSLTDAREAMINAAVDSLSAYGNTIPASQRIGAVPAPFSIRLLPAFVLAMLKSVSKILMHYILSVMP